MRRWLFRSIFNAFLLSSALVVTSIFILQRHASINTSAQGVQQTQQYFESAGGSFYRNSRGASIGAVIGLESAGDYYSTPEQVSEEDYLSDVKQTAVTPNIIEKPTKEALRSIKCEINGDYSIDCLQFKNSVYFPFDFLAKYFEVYGHFKTSNENLSTNALSQKSVKTFQFEHSNTAHGAGSAFGAVNETAVHECDGSFMNFASFNVERRNKVKYVSLSTGVPLSIQWDVTHKGYHFATQVSQYGLSYYSKLVNRQKLNKPSERQVFLTFQDAGLTQQIDSDCFASLSNNNSLKFSCKSFDSPVRVPITVSDALSFQKLPILNLTYEFTSSNGALSFELQMDVVLPQLSAQLLKEQQQKPTSKQQRSIQKAISAAAKTRRLLVLLSYRCDRGVDDVASRWIGTVPAKQPQNVQPVFMVEVTYFISQCPSLVKTSVYRYLAMDVLKGLHILPNDVPAYIRKLSHTDLTLVSIDAVKLSGTGSILNAALIQQAEREFTLLAADWLVQNQSPDGGWAIPIGRQILSGEMKLEPGWYDAMAQGQAMSLLVRAYKLTQHPSYAVAALKASQPFNFPASNKGVVNRLFDKFEWYEEYPTTPGLFVLNGFIYSLIGLYDVSKCLNPQSDPALRAAMKVDAHVNLDPLLARTKELFDNGLNTLRQTLPLFDAGFATFYDLRHLSIPGSQPNIARWDYHDAHIRQLLLLAKIDPEASKNSTLSGDNTYEAGSIWMKTAKRWLGYMRGVRAPHN